MAKVTYSDVWDLYDDYPWAGWRGAAKPERCSTTFVGKCGCGRLTMMGSASLARVGDMAYECGECYEARMILKKLDKLVNG